MHDKTPVLICGAGPVGLTTSILLSRLGIQNLLIEKRGSVSTLPRARGVMSRSVEIWARFGLYDELTRVSLPPHWCSEFVYCDTLAGDLIGRMPSNCMAPNAQARNTAYDFRCTAQDHIDSMLLRHAQTYREAEIRFSNELTGYRQEDDVVVVNVRSADGSDQEIRAQWLVAADGGKSPLREMAGIGCTGPAAIRTFVNNHFSADLSRWTGGREGTLMWILAPGLIGCFQPLDGKQRWMCQFALEPGADSLETWTPERVVRRLRDMINDPAAEDVQFQLHSTYTYTVAATVANRLRDGRLLLVGDAAHRIPPAGGFGMNTGIQTAHNLAWKLASVIRGEASDVLLDTFDTERREVARRACEFGRINVGYLRAIEVAPTREEKRSAIAASKQFGNWAGLDLGVHYEGPGAFVPDDVPIPAVDDSVIEFVPHAKPGHRAPHIWVRQGDVRRSAVDLFERNIVLLTGAEGSAWIDAARRISERSALEILAFRVAIDGDLVPEGDFCKLYGIAPNGAVLVRPDGHVAFRSNAGVDDPDAEVNRAIGEVLRRSNVQENAK